MCRLIFYMRVQNMKKFVNWWFCHREDNLWRSVSFREKKAEIICGIIMLISIFVATVSVIALEANPISIVCVKMCASCALLSLSIGGFIFTKFYNDNAPKKNGKKRDTAYEFEQDWYDADDRNVRWNTIFLSGVVYRKYHLHNQYHPLRIF